MRLKIGIFASSGAVIVNFFSGVVNFLTGNDSGKLIASENGIDFVEVNTSVFGTSNVNDVFYGSDLSIPNNSNAFFAGSDDGKLGYSTNGLTWTTRNTGLTTNVGSIAVAGPLSAGVVWVTRTSNFGGTNIQAIAYGNGQWVAGGNTGQIRTSINPSTPPTLNNIITSTTKAVALANSGRIFSYDTTSTG